MAKKKDVPSEITAALGKTLVKAEPAKVAGSGAQAWVAVGDRQFALLVEGDLALFDWFEFANGAWTGEDRELKLTFIDDEREPLVLSFDGEDIPAVVPVLNERIDDSVVYQQFVKLDSGEDVRGQIRRDRAGELFVQVPWGKAASDGDRAALEQLAVELRDAVGM